MGRGQTAPNCGRKGWLAQPWGSQPAEGSLPTPSTTGTPRNPTLPLPETVLPRESFRPPSLVPDVSLAVRLLANVDPRLFSGLLSYLTSLRFSPVRPLRATTGIQVQRFSRQNPPAPQRRKRARPCRKAGERALPCPAAPKVGRSRWPALRFRSRGRMLAGERVELQTASVRMISGPKREMLAAV